MAVVLIAFIINVFHIISTKQEMDHMADQLVKQIQLNGGTSGETDSLFSFLSSEISGVEGLSYQVSGPGNTGRIQIGTPFYVTVTGRCYLGGFWKFNLVPINVRAQGALTLFSSILAALRMFMQLILTEANSSRNDISMMIARITKIVKKDKSPRSFRMVFLYMAQDRICGDL